MGHDFNCLRELILSEESEKCLPVSAEKPRNAPALRNNQPTLLNSKEEEREWILNRKEQQQPFLGVLQPKGIGLIKTEPHTNIDLDDGEIFDACFKPFVFDGSVSLMPSSHYMSLALIFHSHIDISQ